MSSQNALTIRRMVLAMIALHFAIVVFHSVAHEVLPVKATPAQLAFIIPVIIIAPVVAGFMLLRSGKAGMVLAAASMFGSFAFGLYYHFIADTIDHVEHVARMQPPFWSQMFQVTAYLLALTEIAGALLAMMLLAQAQSLKHHATRTGF